MPIEHILSYCEIAQARPYDQCPRWVLAVQKRLGARSFWAFEVVVFGIGYALIAAVSGRTPMMLITLVIL